MLSLLPGVRVAIFDRPSNTRLGRCAASAAIVAGASAAEYLAHASLSTAVSLDFMAVVIAALRWGLLQSTTMALIAVPCLDFFFVPPIFTFRVADSENWITLLVFEGAALLVSSLSAQMRREAALGELQRRRTAKLYELSRAILFIDAKRSTSEQLSALIRELMQVEHVTFWFAHDMHALALEEQHAQTNPAQATYLSERNTDDRQSRTSCRILRLGTTPIGAMVLRGWEPDPLLADAVSSLAAVAMERARTIERENRAEVARNAEQLRTAVLDGLAHGFKTPLTAIQTASSGLLAIGQLGEVQTELVSIIDEQAILLSQLTTRLLQTAALESRDVRLRRSKQSLQALIDEILREQDPLTRSRVKVQIPRELSPVSADVQLLELALLQLVDNAAKYSRVASTILITVTQDLDETCVLVENEGSAIRPEERERIFERFYRGSDAAHGPTGTGLGLSIVKKTAEAHGGRAWVESEADRTRFFFTVAGGKAG